MTFICRFNNISNGWGRGSILTPIAQAKKRSARKNRSFAAYHNILVARYRGPTRSFMLDDYITKHAAMHAKIFDLREVITELKKVEDFLRGILNPCLKSMKEIRLGDCTNNEDFLTYQ